MPKLDRIPHFDERSRDYPIKPLLAARRPKVDVTWKMPAMMPLDQGQEGACVGFGWSAELAIAPIMYGVSDSFARKLYNSARAEDRAMGNRWDEGASVLAGAKACKRLGVINEYRWAFGVEQVLDALVQRGPVVLGVEWTEGMYDTDISGLVDLSGDVVGGHCITLFGYRKSFVGHECVTWINSWGAGYGIGGVGYLRVTDLEQLLGRDGEACIATDIVRR